LPGTGGFWYNGGMADSFAVQQVARLETLIASCGGKKRIQVDGQIVELADLEKQYDYWTARVARENGTKPRCASINLDGAF